MSQLSNRFTFEQQHTCVHGVHTRHETATRTTSKSCSNVAINVNAQIHWLTLVFDSTKNLLCSICTDNRLKKIYTLCNSIINDFTFVRRNFSQKHSMRNIHMTRETCKLAMFSISFIMAHKTRHFFFKLSRMIQIFPLSSTSVVIRKWYTMYWNEHTHTQPDTIWMSIEKYYHILLFFVCNFWRGNYSISMAKYWIHLNLPAEWKTKTQK